jgi:hypothetical protein
MSKLMPNFVSVGGTALSTVSRLMLKPVASTPHQNHTSVVIGVFREAATGLPFGITDNGDVRRLMLVREPPLMDLGGRVRIGATPQEIRAIRRQLALDAPPIMIDELPELPPGVYDSHDGNGRSSHIAADRVLVPSHD